MVGTIIPIVHGERLRGEQRSLWLYVARALAGGAGSGLILGYGGSAIRIGKLGVLDAAPPLFAIALGYVLLALRELGVCRFPMPQSHWQVPRSWQVSMPRPLAMVAYGAALGSGVLTGIPSGGFYPLVIWSPLLGSPLYGLAVFGAFAIGRAIPVVAMAKATDDSEGLRRWLPIADHSQAIMRLLNALALSACGGWVLGIAIAAG